MMKVVPYLLSPFIIYIIYIYKPFMSIAMQVCIHSGYYPGLYPSIPFLDVRSICAGGKTALN